MAKINLRRYSSIIIAVAGLLILAGVYFLSPQGKNITDRISLENEGGPEPIPHPLSIEALRQGEYPGSNFVIEQTLAPGSNYQRYIASYKSEGLKIYGLLTIPNGDLSTEAPGNSEGYPAIIFNHGYISPSLYRTTEKYVAYQDAFALAGYVTFKSDYRGHGNSEGIASGGYGSNDYTIDILNAVSSMKREGTDMALRQAQGLTSQIINPEKFGMWGHSMGGSITLKAMVAKDDIKVGVIWAGVVGSYEDLFERWRRRTSPTPTTNPNTTRRNWRRELSELYGEPSQNPEFWASLSATSYLGDISGPIQLHHGTADASVPLAFSVNLDRLLKDKEREVELYTYEGDDHNLSNNLSLALSRSVEFFDKYLK